MSDIDPPRRETRPPARRKSVRAPTAGDVPAVDPAAARDPGLDVPDGAFGGGIGAGLEALGGALADVSGDLHRVELRQQRLRDATERARVQTELGDALRDGLVRREREAEFAEPAVHGEYRAFVHNRIVAAKRGYRGLTGAARLSGDAMARLDRDLDAMGRVFLDQAGMLHLAGQERLAAGQLTRMAEEASQRVRAAMAASADSGPDSGEDPFDIVTGELDLFDDAVIPFSGAFRDTREVDLRDRGRAGIVEAAVTGLAAAGRAADAKAILDNRLMAGGLEAADRTRLTRAIDTLAAAHGRDREEQARRAAAAEVRAGEAAALAFTGGFRSRMETGEATHAEIAKARTEGVLTAARADRLRAEMEDALSRRADAAARANRIASLLQSGARPDPDSAEDRTDLVHHYEITLLPGLTDLDPLQKSVAIGAYARDTGMLPDAALDTLMGLSVSGEAADRIAAAGQLSDLLARYPEIRRRVPPTLIDFAGLTGSLASTEVIPPDDIVKLGDGLMRDLTGVQKDQPNPGLVLVASFKSGDGAPANGQTEGARPDTAPDNTETSYGADDDAEDGEDDVFFDEDGEGEVEQPGEITRSPLYERIQARLDGTADAGRKRPTGRLGPGLDKAEEANRARQGSVKPVDPLLADFVGLFNPAVRGAITVNEGIRGFEAFKDMKDAQARGDKRAADDARDRLLGVMLSAVPGGRIFRRGRAAKAGITGKARSRAEKPAGAADKAATTGGGSTGRTGRPSAAELDRQKDLFANPSEHTQYLKRIENGTPLGFASREQFRRLGGKMKEGLEAAGIKDATVVIRGSAVTGRKFDGAARKYVGRKFDGGPNKSDFDFAIVNRELFDKATRNRVGMRGSGTRTDPLTKDQMDSIGLKGFRVNVGRRIAKDRKHGFVIFRDADALKARGPYMIVE